MLLKNSSQQQGIGKPFCHDEFGKNAAKNTNFAEKMRLVSTILVTSKPLIIKLQNYQTAITLEYDTIWYNEANTNDLLHAVSVLIKNQSCFFNDPDTVIIGKQTENNQLEVRNQLKIPKNS
jgi:hypothetical protein